MTNMIKNQSKPLRRKCKLVETKENLSEITKAKGVHKNQKHVENKQNQQTTKEHLRKTNKTNGASQSTLKPKAQNETKSLKQLGGGTSPSPQLPDLPPSSLKSIVFCFV